MRYTDEELRACLTQLAEKLGETPTTTQCNNSSITPSPVTYANRFGSWNGALKATGLSINEQKPSYTDAELIGCLQEFADTLDKTPTRKQLDEEPELPSANLYRSRFGSWNAALEEASLDTNRGRQRRDDLIMSLQECAAELGHTPTKAELRNHEDLPSATTYATRFGSWNDAIRAAGLEVNHEPEPYDGTDEELLEMLRELDARTDTSPTQEDVNFAPDLPSATVFETRFGGWNEAKRQAGLATTRQSNQYTDTELLQELQCVAHEQEKSPTTAEMNNADAPSPSTYCRRFGSWSNALEEAGLVNNREPPTQ